MGYSESSSLPICPLKNKRRHHSKEPHRRHRHHSERSESSYYTERSHRRDRSDSSCYTERSDRGYCSVNPIVVRASPPYREPCDYPCGGCCLDSCSYCVAPYGQAPVYGCPPTYGCAPVCEPVCAPVCEPRINVALLNVSSTQAGSSTTYTYTIRFSTSDNYGGYWSRGYIVTVRPVGVGPSSTYTVLRNSNTEDVTYTLTSSETVPPTLNVYCNSSRLIATLIPGGTPVSPISVTGAIFETGSSGNNVTLTTTVTNTGTSDLTNVLIDIPQPVNTSNYTAGTNYTIINLVGGTFMRFTAPLVPVAGTVVGFFSADQDAAGSYYWSGDILVNNVSSGVNISTTTTYSP